MANDNEVHPRKLYGNPAHLPPRELAKWLICADVARGASIHDIVLGSEGAYSPDGYSVEVRAHRVIVHEAQGRKCTYTFPLEKVVADIQRDLAGTPTQQSLW